jgi:hypothetical protein
MYAWCVYQADGRPAMLLQLLLVQKPVSSGNVYVHAVLPVSGDALLVLTCTQKTVLGVHHMSSSADCCCYYYCTSYAERYCSS